MYDYGDVSGRIRIFDIVISSNNGIVGTPSENLELFISNSIDTAVMADSSNLITSGAVNTALKRLSLGIAEDGLVYLYVNGQAVGTGISVGSGTSSDVYGYVDSNNIVTLQGNLTSGNYTIKYEVLNADGDIIRTYEIGDMELDTTIKNYSVTNNLTNCTNSNTVTSVQEGSSYNATITANGGYVLSSVDVTMGGSPVTVTDGVINIASVTGDIVITAVAEAEVVKTNFFKATPTVSTNSTAPQDAMILGGRLGSDMGYRVDGGPDCLMSNYIPIQNGDEVYVTNLEIGSSLNSGLFANIGDAKAIAIFTSANGNGNVTNNSTNGFTISNTSANYVRICGKPSNSIKVNSTGATVDTKYDCSQIIVNVKRGGAWL
jgi:hypothetical protein